MAGILAARRRLHPLLGRADDRPSVAHARAQHRDMILAEQACQLLRRRIVAIDAHAGSEADRAIDNVEMIRAVAREPRKIEAFENAQREQKLEPFAWWRRHMNLTPAV